MTGEHLYQFKTVLPLENLHQGAKFQSNLIVDSFKKKQGGPQGNPIQHVSCHLDRKLLYAAPNFNYLELIQVTWNSKVQRLTFISSFKRVG